MPLGRMDEQLEHGAERTYPLFAQEKPRRSISVDEERHGHVLSLRDLEANVEPHPDMVAPGI